MKRLSCLILALMLALTLFGCGKKKTQPSPTPSDSSTVPPAEEAAPLQLDVLNIEFAAEGHDADALLALKSELPAPLIRALDAEGVQVGRVAVTFGTSADATWQALADGGIDIAFLPSAVALMSEATAHIIAVENAPAAPDSEALALCPELADGAIFYENAVALSAEADEALCRALPHALAMLCADADGYAALRLYGTGAYLVSPAPEDLLAPYGAYLTAAAEAALRK